MSVLYPEAMLIIVRRRKQENNHDTPGAFIGLNNGQNGTNKIIKVLLLLTLYLYDSLQGGHCGSAGILE